MTAAVAPPITIPLCLRPLFCSQAFSFLCSHGYAFRRWTEVRDAFKIILSHKFAGIGWLERLSFCKSWTHHLYSLLSLNHTVFIPECHSGCSFILCKWADRNIVSCCHLFIRHTDICHFAPISRISFILRIFVCYGHYCRSYRSQMRHCCHCL